MSPPSPGALSQGTLLGGRVRYAQPVVGYRTGIEPVLLAAAIPARPGQRVLEAGTGAGAGLLCLSARVPDLHRIAVELDPAMAALARHNLDDNGFDSAVHVSDVADAAGLGPVDHAFANPPWHDPAGTRPAEPGRDRAKHLRESGLAPWITGLAGALGARGTLSVVIPAALLGDAMARLVQAGFGRSTILPLWPRAGVAAKLLLIQARRGPGPSRLLPGLILHEGAGYTPSADLILRDGAALPI